MMSGGTRVRYARHHSSNDDDDDDDDTAPLLDRHGRRYRTVQAPPRLPGDRIDTWFGTRHDNQRLSGLAWYMLGRRNTPAPTRGELKDQLTAIREAKRAKRRAEREVVHVVEGALAEGRRKLEAVGGREGVRDKDKWETKLVRYASGVDAGNKSKDARAVRRMEVQVERRVVECCSKCKELTVRAGGSGSSGGATETASREKPASDKPASEKPASDRAKSQKADSATAKPASGKVGSDKPASAKAGSDKPAGDKAGSETAAKKDEPPTQPKNEGYMSKADKKKAKREAKEKAKAEAKEKAEKKAEEQAKPQKAASANSAAKRSTASKTPSKKDNGDKKSDASEFVFGGMLLFGSDNADKKDNDSVAKGNSYYALKEPRVGESANSAASYAASTQSANDMPGEWVTDTESKHKIKEKNGDKDKDKSKARDTEKKAAAGGRDHSSSSRLSKRENRVRKDKEKPWKPTVETVKEDKEPTVASPPKKSASTTGAVGGWGGVEANEGGVAGAVDGFDW